MNYSSITHARALNIYVIIYLVCPRLRARCIQYRGYHGFEGRRCVQGLQCCGRDSRNGLEGVRGAGGQRLSGGEDACALMKVDFRTINPHCGSDCAR